MTMTGLLRDTRTGRLSALRALTLAFAVLPGLQLALGWYMGALGPRPNTEVTHGTGEWAVRFLLMALAVTPVRAVFNWPQVVQLRRLLGVTAACYACAHLIVFCVDKKWNLLTVASEIALRFYLTIGFATLLGLLALAVTSTDGWQKRLGRNWKRLHKIVFALAVLGLFHYFLQAKADVTSAALASGFFIWLTLWRQLRKPLQTKVLPLLPLAFIAAVATALVEAGWYEAATKVHGWMVLQANWDPDVGLRPAHVVLLCGLVVFAVAAVRRLWSRRRRRVPANAVAHTG
jgi:methionine sulfoxide reductase heme-binding subunit